jgi:outer membrane protein with beta-barrel domain
VHGGKIVWRRAAFVALMVIAGGHGLLHDCSVARAADIALPPPPPPPVVPPPIVAPQVDPAYSRFYVGGAFNWVHHTGYVPNSPTEASAAEYTVGFKTFGGYRFTPQNSVEVAYHYLGRVHIEGMPVETTEQSWAVAASFVHVSPPWSQWLGPGPFGDYLHSFVRFGLAYKHIEQDSVIGTLDEGIVSLVIGTGVEARFTPEWFGRIEYEYISTAIGGPPQRVPGFKGLYAITIGGTNRTINVMNTPLAITIGRNF